MAYGDPLPFFPLPRARAADDPAAARGADRKRRRRARARRWRRWRRGGSSWCAPLERRVRMMREMRSEKCAARERTVLETIYFYMFRGGDLPPPQEKLPHPGKPSRPGWILLLAGSDSTRALAPPSKRITHPSFCPEPNDRLRRIL